jgi:hypothetical protein
LYQQFDELEPQGVGEAFRGHQHGVEALGIEKSGVRAPSQQQAHALEDF